MFLVTSRHQEKLETAKQQGAAAGVLSTSATLVQDIRQLTEKRGVDLVVDTVGAVTWQQSLACLRPGGTIGYLRRHHRAAP